MGFGFIIGESIEGAIGGGGMEMKCGYTVVYVGSAKGIPGLLKMKPKHSSHDKTHGRQVVVKTHTHLNLFGEEWLCSAVRPPPEPR